MNVYIDALSTTFFVSAVSIGDLIFLDHFLLHCIRNRDDAHGVSSSYACTLVRNRCILGEQEKG